MNTQHHEAGGAKPALTVQQAIAEASRCLLCHDAPCSQGCPGGTDPAKFIRQIRFFNFKGAARTVLRNNPLGGVCAHVCPSGETCVKACLRSGLDRPIDIDGLQRFAVDHGRQLGLTALFPGEPRPEKVAVVGGGPAGLAAAARLAQLGYKVTLLEARAAVGGMLRYGVPESRLSDAALDADLAEILALGVEVRTGMKLESENAALGLLDQGFAAVFVAPGLWAPAQLKVPGIELDGVSNAIEFLALARTDAAAARGLVEGRAVAVIGGGSVAMDVAHVAKLLGARRLYAIALEGMAELPAAERELALAFADGVSIKAQCMVTKILGEAGRVVSVEGVETEWIDPAGKLIPSNARPIEGTSFALRVGAVIQAIGQGPAPGVGGLVAAAAKERGLLVADEKTAATTVARIFAGGDVVRGAGTVVQAVGDGTRAATAIHELLSGSKEVAR
jgi:NADPH-dependent glutamate synthase beta subunit-like oxidoreductase